MNFPVSVQTTLAIIRALGLSHYRQYHGVQCGCDTDTSMNLPSLHCTMTTTREEIKERLNRLSRQKDEAEQELTDIVQRLEMTGAGLTAPLVDREVGTTQPMQPVQKRSAGCCCICL